MKLTVDALIHRFDARATDAAPALDITHLTAGSGDLTVISGPSGSGKSTLLYALSGLLKPVSGSIKWAETDLATLGESARDKWRRQHAGFIFQNFHLIGEMTPLQNVTVAAYFDGWSNRRVRDRAVELLERFGVPADMRPAETFSRGEQQRIALSRALLFDPPILFADEPTASLDADHAKEIADLLKQMATDGKAVLVVSHDPVLQGQATNTAILAYGRLADRPTSREKAA